MSESLRRQYLEALEITVWVRKPAATERARMCIGPGSGSTLFVCRDGAESALPVAADICRYLAVVPVWAWPDPAGRVELPCLEDAIGLHMYTRVFLWGQALAAQILNGRNPAIIGSARIVVVPGLEELSRNPGARKDLWRQASKISGLTQ